MARIVTQRTEATCTGVGIIFSFPLPTPSRLVKIDVCNRNESGTDFTVLLSNYAGDQTADINTAVSLLHHEIGIQNRNISWEASSDWFVSSPQNYVVVVADTVVTAGDVLSLVVTYEVES